MKTGSLFKKVQKIETAIRILILLGPHVFLISLVVWIIYFVWFIYIPMTEEIMKTQEESAGLQEKRNQARTTAANRTEDGYEEVGTQFPGGPDVSSQYQRDPGYPENDYAVGHGFPAGIITSHPSERKGLSVLHGD